MWKETVDIDILVTSRNGSRKIMQSVAVIESVELVQTRQDFSLSRFDNELRDQERQLVKELVLDIGFCSFSKACNAGSFSSFFNDI